MVKDTETEKTKEKKKSLGTWEETNEVIAEKVKPNNLILTDSSLNNLIYLYEGQIKKLFDFIKENWKNLE